MNCKEFPKNRPILTRVLLGAALFLLAAAWTGPLPAAPQVSFQGEGGLKVMTYNMYLGADITLAIGATSEPEFIQAVTEIVQNMRASDPEARIAAIAQEIAEVRPHLISLQEVAIWRTGPAPNALTVEFDFLQLLLTALAEENLEYAPIVVMPHFDMTAPFLTASGLGFVRFTQSIAILARTDLPPDRFRLSNFQADFFDTKLVVPLLGELLEIPRAWASMDVRFQNKDFRFVATHLEAFSPLITIAQSLELLNGPANTPLPTILAGDFNSNASEFSDPSFAAYQNFLDAAFTDVWLAVTPFDAGFTCCQDPDLSNPISDLDQRIDFVFVRGPFLIHAAERFGEEPGDRTSGGLWPSDHAAVAGRLVQLGRRVRGH